MIDGWPWDALCHMPCCRPLSATIAMPCCAARAAAAARYSWPAAALQLAGQHAAAHQVHHNAPPRLALALQEAVWEQAWCGWASAATLGRYTIACKGGLSTHPPSRQTAAPCCAFRPTDQNHCHIHKSVHSVQQLTVRASRLPNTVSGAVPSPPMGASSCSARASRSHPAASAWAAVGLHWNAQSICGACGAVPAPAAPTLPPLQTGNMKGSGVAGLGDTPALAHARPHQLQMH